MLRCGPALTPSAPDGTSRRITEPAPVYAPSPISTGATSTVLEPMRARAPITVRCFSLPS